MSTRKMSWNELLGVPRPGSAICKMGKENLLIRSGTAGTNLNVRKKYNKYYYFINTHKSFILYLFAYGTEKASE